MSWIEEVDEGKATGDVRAAYDKAMKFTGHAQVPPIIKIFSLRPDLLKARVGFASAMTFGGSGLGRRAEELIATSISGLLSCKF